MFTRSSTFNMIQMGLIIFLFICIAIGIPILFLIDNNKSNTRYQIIHWHNNGTADTINAKKIVNNGSSLRVYTENEQEYYNISGDYKITKYKAKDSK